MLSHCFYFVVHVYFIALNLSIKVIYLISLKLHWVEYMEYTCACTQYLNLTVHVF